MPKETRLQSSKPSRVTSLIPETQRRSCSACPSSCRGYKECWCFWSRPPALCRNTPRRHMCCEINKQITESSHRQLYSKQNVDKTWKKGLGLVHFHRKAFKHLKKTSCFSCLCCLRKATSVLNLSSVLQICRKDEMKRSATQVLRRASLQLNTWFDSSIIFFSYSFCWCCFPNINM